MPYAAPDIVGARARAVQVAPDSDASASIGSALSVALHEGVGGVFAGVGARASAADLRGSRFRPPSCRCCGWTLTHASGGQCGRRWWWRQRRRQWRVTRVGGVGRRDALTSPRVRDANSGDCDGGAADGDGAAWGSYGNLCSGPPRWARRRWVHRHWQLQRRPMWRWLLVRPQPAVVVYRRRAGDGSSRLRGWWRGAFSHGGIGRGVLDEAPIAAVAAVQLGEGGRDVEGR